ncbi:hypothetical protein ABT294_08100 [Nonomuraea sp. NPDC000554]|uniref:hypothetical protein n=1 Tax=Nonomuraea sp. NPDC000554 TaxID=3154259 RepID=UPI00333041CE
MRSITRRIAAGLVTVAATASMAVALGATSASAMPSCSKYEGKTYGKVSCTGTGQWQGVWDCDWQADYWTGWIAMPSSQKSSREFTCDSLLIHIDVMTR